MLGLNRVTDETDGSERVVQRPPRPFDQRPYGMAVAVFAIGLLVTGHELGFPNPADVDVALTN